MHHSMLPDNDLNFDTSWLSWVIRNATYVKSTEYCYCTDEVPIYCFLPRQGTRLK